MYVQGAHYKTAIKPYGNIMGHLRTFDISRIIYYEIVPDQNLQGEVYTWSAHRQSFISDGVEMALHDVLTGNESGINKLYDTVTGVCLAYPTAKEEARCFRCVKQ